MGTGPGGTDSLAGNWDNGVGPGASPGRLDTASDLMTEPHPHNPSSQGRAALPPELVGLVDTELRQIAAAYLRRQRPGHTLQPTALVNEAFLRLARSNPESFTSRAHFLRVAAIAMRQILINHAEGKVAQKRGGGAGRVAIDQVDVAAQRGLGPEETMAIESCLRKLEELDPRKASVVEAKIYGGLTHEEIAESLGVSLSTVESDWRMAKAWLAHELAGR